MKGAGCLDAGPVHAAALGCAVRHRWTDLIQTERTVHEALLAQLLGDAVQVQDSPLHLLAAVLRADGGQLCLWDLLVWVFNHALGMVVAQFGAGADDGPAKPLVQDL